MYQALYRKYRPKTFDDVVGQNVIVQILKNSIKNNKLSHAYLFAGPRGTGKTSIAKILAKTINCENLNNLKPCDNCVNCTQFNNNQLTDVIEIDAASNNGVDEIRELKNKISLAPNTGKYKVYIIDEVHMLTVGAFNALLKTLEEPPKHIIFVLATTELQKIPSTIISRCQCFDFKRIPSNLIFEHLKDVAEKEKISIDDNSLKEIAYLSEGGMRDALSILDQVSSFSDKKIIINDVHEVSGTLPKEEIKTILESLFNNDLSAVFMKLDKYINRGKNLSKLLEEIVLFLKNILLYQTAFDYFKETDSNYSLYNLNISQAELIKAIEHFNNTLNVMRQSSNSRIIFETSLIKLINVNLKIKEGLEVQKNLNDSKENVSVSERSEIEKKVNFETANSKIKEALKPVKEIRINNALSNFNKKKMLEFKKRLDDIQSLILNPEYNYEASLLLDGELKVLGNNYVVFVYETENISDLFNEKIIKIEKMFKNVFNDEYKIISTFIDDWNIIKDKFNSKKENYVFKEDNIDVLSIFENKNNINLNDIDKTFDDIVEYV